MTLHRWLILAVVFVVLEILPPVKHFLLLCFAFGALGAAIATTFAPVAWMPWAVFAVVSGVLVPFLIPFAKFLFGTKTSTGNGESIVGHKALVTETILPGTPGMVSIGGHQWRAMTSELDPIHKNEWAQVLRVEGTHLIVTAGPK